MPSVYPLSYLWMFGCLQHSSPQVMLLWIHMQVPPCVRVSVGCLPPRWSCGFRAIETQRSGLLRNRTEDRDGWVDAGAGGWGQVVLALRPYLFQPEQICLRALGFAVLLNTFCLKNGFCFKKKKTTAWKPGESIIHKVLQVPLGCVSFEEVVGSPSAQASLLLRPALHWPLTPHMQPSLFFSAAGLHFCIFRVQCSKRLVVDWLIDKLLSNLAPLSSHTSMFYSTQTKHFYFLI